MAFRCCVERSNLTSSVIDMEVASWTGSNCLHSGGSFVSGDTLSFGCDMRLVVIMRVVLVSLTMMLECGRKVVV
jgi:hypothetical protein